MSILSKTEIFCDGLDHPECVAYQSDGTVWAGGEAGQIYHISADGKHVKEVANTKGFILGIALSNDLSWLLICDSGNKCLWRMDTKTFVLEKFGMSDHTFNIPNYACFDKHGNVYVSESGPFRNIKGKIIKYNKEGQGHVWCKGPFNFSNGMALDAAEEFIYVACSFLPGVERVQIQANGSAGNREVFATLPESVPDGLAFDAAGNLYVSCYAPNKIYKITPKQEVSVLVDDWEAHTLSNPTNIAFGGKNFDQLFVANIGRWHISKINLGEKGLPLTCNR